MKVLLIESNPVKAEKTKNELIEFGIEDVLTASNGLEALKILGLEDIDMIITEEKVFSLSFPNHHHILRSTHGEIIAVVKD